MRIIYTVACVVALTALIFPQELFAQSLKEKKMHAEAEKDIQDDLKRLKDGCGADIAFSFDWSGFDVATAKNNSINGYCSEAVVANIAGKCENEDLWKESVKKSIKSITCGFGPERKIELTEGKLHYVISFNSSNDGKYAVEYLENNM